MSEPSTAIVVVTAVSGVTLSSLLLGLDGNAVVGAFAGAVLMMLSSHDIHWASRITYLFVSWVMGYIAAPELMNHLPIQHSGVAAFLAAALVVTVTLQLIERAKHFDLASWFTRRGGGGPS